MASNPYKMFQEHLPLAWRTACGVALGPVETGVGTRSVTDHIPEPCFLISEDM